MPSELSPTQGPSIHPHQSISSAQYQAGPIPFSQVHMTTDNTPTPSPDIESNHSQAAESSFDWLIRALGGVVDGPSQPMLARPDALEPSLLIPLGTRSATEAALRRGHDDRDVRTRLITSAGRTLGRMGMLPRVTGQRLAFPMTRVLKDLQEVIGDPSLQISIGAGPPRRNRKPVIMMIRGNGEIAGFAKVGWSPFTVDLVSNEFELLGLVDGELPHPILTPAPLRLLKSPGRVVAVTSAMRSHDWSRPRPLLPEMIDEIGRSVGHRHARVADLTWLTNPTLGDRNDEKSTHLRAAIAKVSERFGSNPIEVGLWHGDLNHWNLISSGKGISVIDWEFAGLDRPIGQDRRHLRFEKIRRNVSTSPEAAVSSFVDAELRGSSTTVELALYLADIAIRESQLSGQGWSGAMSGYRAPLTTALQGLMSS